MHKMTLLEHIQELKQRIIYVLIFFVVAFLSGYIFAPTIRDIMLIPLINSWHRGVLLYTNLTDGFFIKLSLASCFALFLTCPFFLYQAYKYVAPGLHKNEKSFVKPIVILSPLLFLIGVCFVYFILLPLVFQFFISESGSTDSIRILLRPTLSSYLQLSIKFMKIFGLAFQFPLILVILNRLGIINPDTIKKYRRLIVIGIAIISAILTPPDVLSMLLLGIPLYFMFEASLYFMRPLKS